MSAPREVQDFCRRFHQDAFRISPGMREAIGAVLKSFDDRQRKVMKEFIYDLLNNDNSGINSGTELKRLWQMNNSEFGLRGGAKAYKKFFREVLNQLTDVA
jgi:hypothetical protein